MPESKQSVIGPAIKRIHQRIADEINATTKQVNSAVELLDSGATVPFISRYRKEATGGLSDSQLRLLEERLSYLRELGARRSAITKVIDEQGKLDATLSAKLTAAETKSELEDLYLPFKQKRKTKGVLAIEAGLQPLADSLWQQPSNDPESSASRYVNLDKGVADLKAALDGARFILMERFAEDAELIARLRKLLKEKSWLCASVIRGKETEGEKYQNYFDFQERLSTVPSHRALAMFRGRSEGILSLSLKLQQTAAKEDEPFGIDECLYVVAQHTGFTHRGAAADNWRQQVVNWTWKVKLSHHLESDLFLSLREVADAEAIRVFASNLRDLLLAAPAGELCTLGLDPGYRSGVKVAVSDKTGRLVDHTTIYPHAPQKHWNKALAEIARLCKIHNVELIAIGNGTASRETDQFAEELIKTFKPPGLRKVIVSEAGASVYSASLTAEQEFPDVDVTVRGAMSIARRLQDPLAELVKIDPKAIGVGQYQHDVSQPALARSLDATVEDCVNSVGVDLNTASSALLARVAGVGSTIATNIVQYRDEKGPFAELKALHKVPRLGPKAFEQCAGFLRIISGKNPLDASGVHPEAYPVVKDIVKRSGKKLDELMGDTHTLKSIDPQQYINEKFGLPTVQDILLELDKPGRDPRPEFHTVSFTEGVNAISDLTANQILEGQVTNVTNFGAFVDIGVHQDGLVHISCLSERFVKDPHEVVKAGDIVKVKVMSLAPERNRIGLSMRLNDDATDPENTQGTTRQSTPQRHSSDIRETPDCQARQGTGKSQKNRQNKTNSSSSTPSALALALQASLDKSN